MDISQLTNELDNMSMQPAAPAEPADHAPHAPLAPTTDEELLVIIEELREEDNFISNATADAMEAGIKKGIKRILESNEQTEDPNIQAFRRSRFAPPIKRKRYYVSMKDTEFNFKREPFIDRFMRLKAKNKAFTPIKEAVAGLHMSYGGTNLVRIDWIVEIIQGECKSKSVVLQKLRHMLFQNVKVGPVAGKGCVGLDVHALETDNDWEDAINHLETDVADMGANLIFYNAKE
jgi:hypothetical protein